MKCLLWPQKNSAGSLKKSVANEGKNELLVKQGSHFLTGKKKDQSNGIFPENGQLHRSRSCLFSYRSLKRSGYCAAGYFHLSLFYVLRCTERWTGSTDGLCRSHIRPHLPGICDPGGQVAGTAWRTLKAASSGPCWTCRCWLHHRPRWKRWSFPALPSLPHENTSFPCFWVKE